MDKQTMIISKDFKIFTASENELIIKEEMALARKVWPEFMLHDPIAGKYFGKLYSGLTDFQFGAIDITCDKLIAVGNCIPFHWDKPLEDLPDKGWDWVLEKGFRDIENKLTPNFCSALQIMIDPKYLGQGLSSKIVEYMIGITKKNRLLYLVAPVRPNFKPKYPLTHIDNYIKWENDQGLPFDPWLRVHTKLGGKIIKPCHKAMTISGSVKEWEEWAQLKFYESGEYVIPGALKPIEIDLSNNTGKYIEPNVWVAHKIL